MELKETGIMMSGNHPKLILDGTKTMTRRVIKPQPIITGQFADYKNLTTLIENLFEFCPYGQIGQRLWVRETWANDPETGGKPLLYKADMTWEPESYFKQDGGKWRPSIFMPRWASRITLEITEVRVAKLNDMTENDAHAEGVDNLVTFMLLWDSLNAKRGYGWTSNPFVWCISFRRVN